MPRKKCPECGKMYPAYSPFQKMCKTCAAQLAREEAEATARAAMAPLAGRTCAHRERVLVPESGGDARSTLPMYRLDCGTVERWCPACLRWYGKRYGARRVTEQGAKR